MNDLYEIDSLKLDNKFIKINKQFPRRFSRYQVQNDYRGFVFDIFKIKI